MTGTLWPHQGSLHQPEGTTTIQAGEPHIHEEALKSLSDSLTGTVSPSEDHTLEPQICSVQSCCALALTQETPSGSCGSRGSETQLSSMSSLVLYRGPCT